MTDVDRIDDYLGECCRDTKVLEAWQTLKTAVLGTTTNMPTTPLPCKDGHTGIKHNYPYNIHCPCCGILLSTAQ